MARFKIDFDLEREKFPPKSPILSYPDVSEHDRPIFGWIGLGGLLYLEIDDKPLFSDTSEEREYFFYDRLFPTFGQLINSLHYLIKSEEVSIELELSGFRMLTVKPIDNKVSVSFDNKGKKGINVQDVQITLEEYATEVIRVFDRYVRELIEINPRLKDGKELKALIKACEKAKKIYEEHGIKI